MKDTAKEPTRFTYLEVDVTELELNSWRKSVAGKLQSARELAEQGNWVPACGGTEVPFKSRSGRVLQYLWQPSTGRHAYLDCGTDTLLSDEEACAHLAG